jgi:glycosyltransferase involved in cell wall biosynthesis
LPQRELVGLYRRAWLLLAPSRVLANGRRDGIPNVTIEAMAMEFRARDRGRGLEEAITTGETGSWYRPTMRARSRTH